MVYEAHLNARGEYYINVHKTPFAFLVVALSCVLMVVWEIVAAAIVVVRALHGNRPTRVDLIALALPLVLFAAGWICDRPA